MNKITNEEFKKLYSDDIKKTEYDDIIAQIDERFGDVVLLIHPKIKDDGWFVYGNYNHYDEDDEGEFDIDDYKTEISIGGTCEFPEPYCYTDEGTGYIPTRWLWTDDDQILKEFKAEVEKSKNEKLAKKDSNKQKRELLKRKKAEMKSVIQSKLTKEELKFIKFK